MAGSINTMSLPLPSQSASVATRPNRESVPATSNAEVVVERQPIAADSSTPVPQGDASVAERPTDEAALELAQAAENISSFMQSVSRSLQISVDDELGTMIVKVVDGETEEVVRQIPAEETLAVARALSDQQANTDEGSAVLGLLLDSEG